MVIRALANTTPAGPAHAQWHITGAKRTPALLWAPADQGVTDVLDLLLVIASFIAGWLGAWAWLRARQRREGDTSQRRIATLMDRADRLAGEKVLLLTKLERHGEDLVAIKQQLVARERALYAITGTWPVTPPLWSDER